MMADFRSIWLWLSLALLAILTVFLLYPFVSILIASFGAVNGKASGWATLLSEPKYARAILNTILLGAAE